VRPRIAWCTAVKTADTTATMSAPRNAGTNPSTEKWMPNRRPMERREHQHERVQDEGEEPERQDDHRARQELQHGPDQRVHEAEDESDREDRSEPVGVDSRHEIRGGRERGGVHQEVEKKAHLTLPARDCMTASGLRPKRFVGHAPRADGTIFTTPPWRANV
jgi:hypothetical protein